MIHVEGKDLDGKYDFDIVYVHRCIISDYLAASRREDENNEQILTKMKTNFVTPLSPESSNPGGECLCFPDTTNFALEWAFICGFLEKTIFGGIKSYG